MQVHRRQQAAVSLTMGPCGPIPSRRLRRTQAQHLRQGSMQLRVCACRSSCACRQGAERVQRGPVFACIAIWRWRCDTNAQHLRVSDGHRVTTLGRAKNRSIAHTRAVRRCGSNPPLQQAADLDQTAIRVAAEIDNTAPVVPVRCIGSCSMMTPAATMWCCACCCTVAMIRHGSADPGVGTRALGSNARPAACRLIFCCPKANAGRPSPNSPAAYRARAHQGRRWHARRQR